jgi:biotin operon repressor
MRRAVLATLATAPASAAAVADVLGSTRQKVNYHLRALARHGLVVETGTRRHGGIVERIWTPSAIRYAVDPHVLGEVAVRPDATPDRLSAAYAVALAARVVRDVGAMLRRARVAGRSLPTLSIDADIRFRSAAERAAFADELRDTVLALAGRYHDESARDGRWYRLTVLAHPRPKEDDR